LLEWNVYLAMGFKRTGYCRSRIAQTRPCLKESSWRLKPSSACPDLCDDPPTRHIIASIEILLVCLFLLVIWKQKNVFISLSPRNPLGVF